MRGGTFSRDLLTDRDGRYELTGIPIGTVSISVLTPFGFRTDAGRTVEVKDLRACVAANFRVHAESAAHGIVIDQMGLPVAGVSVEAVAEELAGHQPKAIHPSVKTDHQGRFAFAGLPPGSYVFGINITKGLGKPPSRPPLFLPGTTAIKETPVFDLKPGDRVDVGSIRLANR